MDNQTVVKQLVSLTQEVARGDYDRAQEIFDLTKDGTQSTVVEELAESFGMMMVQVEAREFRLEQLIEELKQTNQELADTLNKVKLLENIQDHMSKFVPQSVTDIIETNPDSPDLDKRDRDVTVLFLDVAGYTKLSEKVDAEEMNFLIERYFSAFLDEIHRNQGDINETAGDGLMIIFLADDPVLNAKNAVTTAVTIREQVRLINLEDQGKHEPIIVNIGINSGQCSVGSTRFEGISGTRCTFTASGSVTNLAARIGAQATDGSIFVGPETHNRVKDEFQTRDVGERRLKNVSLPVQIFEVID